MLLSARCDARSAASEPGTTPDHVRGGLSPERAPLIDWRMFLSANR
jgi:hypothetical protein